MKRIIFLFCLLSSSLNLFAQNLTDAAGKKQGRWVLLGDFEPEFGVKPIIEVKYENDTANGLLRKYDNRKVLRYEVLVIKGKRQGSAKVFDKKGRLTAIGNYVDDDLRLSVVYRKKNRVYQITNYRNGQIDGLQTTLYRNGQVKTNEVFKNGLMEGESIEYYKNGNLKTVYYYKNDAYYRYVNYDKNGKIINQSK